MESKSILIGEHVLRLSFAGSDVRLLFDQTFPCIFTHPSAHPHLQVRLDQGYGMPFVNYDIYKETLPDGMNRYERADYLIEADESFQNVSIQVFDSLALKHALMHLYSLYILRQQYGLLVHSSCVVDKDNAYLFTGHSGAGKSTAASLSLGRGIISDEATVLRIRSDGVSVFHSPFRSELQDMAATEPREWPLAGIHLLHQAKQHKRYPLAKAEGFLKLMDKVFFWNPAPAEAMLIMRLLRQLADLVPLYDLHFQKNPDFWELIS